MEEYDKPNMEIITLDREITTIITSGGGDNNLNDINTPYEDVGGNN